MKSRSIVILAASAAASLVLLCGCESSRYQSVKDDPTPNADTLYQRNVDVDNSLVIWGDENWRMFTQDLGRAFYTDRPSRLTREPIPHP